MKKKKYNIAQIGSFDVENYGDLLFATVLENNLRKIINIENIILFAPMHCKMPFYENVQVYSVSELEEKHLEYNFDAIIVGGGDLIHLEKINVIIPYISEKPVLYDALNMWIVPGFIAAKYDIPLIWNCPGVPSGFSDNSKELIKEMINLVDYLSVRDSISKNKLLECGIEKDIIVSPDTVLSISKIIKKEELEKVLDNMKLNFNKNDKYIVFHANAPFTDEDRKISADILKRIKDEYGYKIVIQPIGYALGDMQALIDIYNYYPKDFILIKNKLSPIEMISVISSSKCYIGASLHGSIIANSYGVPSIVCNYTNFNKIEGYFKLINKEKYVLNKPVDIYDAFMKAMSGTFLVDDSLYERIQRHFENMAAIIEKDQKPKEISSFAEELCQYVFNNYQIEQLIILKDNHINNITNELKSSNLHIQKLSSEIEQRKTEIEQRKTEIEQQKTEIEQQKIEIEQQKIEIGQMKLKLEKVPIILKKILKI